MFFFQAFVFYTLVRSFGRFGRKKKLTLCFSFLFRPPPRPTSTKKKKLEQLEGLKRLCEASLAGSLTVAGLRSTYELSEAFSAPQLGRRCVLFALEKYDAVSAALEPAGFCALMRRMVPKLRESLTEQMVLKKEQQAAAAGAGGATAATAVAAVAGGGA